MSHMFFEAGQMRERAKEKVRSLSQSDIPIAERRALYNAMARKFKNSSNLKPGLLQKYNACLGSKKDRFSLLKEFIIDENMLDTQFLRNFAIIHLQMINIFPLVVKVGG